MKQKYKRFMQYNRKDIKNLLLELKQLNYEFYLNDLESDRMDLIIKTLVYYCYQFNYYLNTHISYKQFINLFV